ncbi:MAG: PDZ domain-containing protein, partial [Candidatus Binatia bacterium]
RRTRVVLLMSQCYSGGFATLGSRGATDDRNVCGYFSTTADRLAYGCYPEDRGRDGVGHAFAFFRALERSGSFPEAHAETLVTDRTPDVPFTTSDMFLERLLEQAAERADESVASLGDRLLDEARGDGGRTCGKSSDDLLLRMSRGFGEPVPASLRELDERLARVRRATEALGVYTKAWEAAVGDANRASLDRFLRERPEWKVRLESDDLDFLTTRAAFLPALTAFSREHSKSHERILALGKGFRDARALRHRMEVREAALLRMRMRLLSIAGEAYLSTMASPAEREAYEGLRSCESLRLGRPTEGSADRREIPPFPQAEEDWALLETVRTPRIGIDHEPADPEEFFQGAAAVRRITPGSPAERAGLRIGDVILGPPGDPFTERNELRGWLKLVPIGEPVSLEVDRKEKRIVVTVEPEDAAPSGERSTRRSPTRR